MQHRRGVRLHRHPVLGAQLGEPQRGHEAHHRRARRLVAADLHAGAVLAHAVGVVDDRGGEPQHPPLHCLERVEVRRRGLRRRRCRGRRTTQGRAIFPSLNVNTMKIGISPSMPLMRRRASARRRVATTRSPNSSTWSTSIWSVSHSDAHSALVSRMRPRARGRSPAPASAGRCGSRRPPCRGRTCCRRRRSSSAPRSAGEYEVGVAHGAKKWTVHPSRELVLGRARRSSAPARLTRGARAVSLKAASSRI